MTSAKMGYDKVKAHVNRLRTSVTRQHGVGC